MQKRQYYYLSRQIFFRYMMSMALVCLVLFGGLFVAWFLCSQRTWYGTEPLYSLLKIFEAFAPLVIVGVLITSFFIFTMRAIREPFRYLTDLTEAAKRLSHPTEELIELAPELSDVQNELNLRVRFNGM